MQTFKQFCESSWDKLVYHATFKKDFKPHSGMHVGSLHAAMARAYSTKSHEDYPENLVVHAFKHNATGKETHAKDPSKYSGMNRRTESDLMKKKLKKGSTHITYKNAVEDPGSKSKIIYEPNELKHVKSFKSPKFISRKYTRKDYEPKPGGSRMTLPYFSRSKGQRKANKL